MTKIRDTIYIKVFGEQVRKLRVKKNISQEDLAYEADVPINQIGRIERGEVNTTISTLYAIAKALNLKPSELLNFKIKNK